MASVLGSTSVAALAQPASAPAAQTAPSTTVSPLTVETAPTPKVIEKQSQSFVQTYAAAPNPEIDQIGRWRDPVCVQVVGLPQADQAAAIKARIESVAQAVGLPAARPGCKANVEILFSDQPQRTMDIVAQRQEYLLGYYHRERTNALRTVTHPIQAWYVTSTRGTSVDTAGLVFALVKDAAGDPLTGSDFPGLATQNETVDDPQHQNPNGCAGSRITSCLRSAFSNVFMVADSKALEGEDLGLVADDMVMLALSQPKSLDGCNALPSVIDMFAKSPCPGRDPPDGLTHADAAYLTALYSADLEAKKNFEVGEITSRMAAILIKAATRAQALSVAQPARAPATVAEDSTELSGLTVVARNLPDMTQCRMPLDGRWPADLFDQSSKTAKHRTDPSPGTEEYLRKDVDFIENGTRNYGEMTPQLSEIAKIELPILEQRFKCLGSIQSIKFLHVSDADYDDYEVNFQNGAFEWAIAPLNNLQQSHSQFIRFFEPRPATNELRGLIRSFQNKHPEYDAISPTFSSSMEERWPILRDKFKEWGRLESIYFVRQTDYGSYIYLATLRNTGFSWSDLPMRTAWSITLDPEDGKIASMAYTIFK
jgi:hypothetical protein